MLSTLGIQRVFLDIPLAQVALPGGLVSVAIAFFIIAIVAYIFGAKGVAGMSASVGRTLLFVFLILAVISMVVGLIRSA